MQEYRSTLAELPDDVLAFIADHFDENISDGVKTLAGYHRQSVGMAPQKKKTPSYNSFSAQSTIFSDDYSMEAFVPPPIQLRSSSLPPVDSITRANVDLQPIYPEPLVLLFHESELPALREQNGSFSVALSQQPAPPMLGLDLGITLPALPEGPVIPEAERLTESPIGCDAFVPPCRAKTPCSRYREASGPENAHQESIYETASPRREEQVSTIAQWMFGTNDPAATAVPDTGGADPPAATERVVCTSSFNEGMGRAVVSGSGLPSRAQTML